LLFALAGLVLALCGLLAPVCMLILSSPNQFFRLDEALHF
jgi:hypothetical protein